MAIDRVRETQGGVVALGRLLTRLNDAIARQKGVLARLETAIARGESAEVQIKALREALTYLMVFQALGEQVERSFAGFEAPLTGLLDEVARELRDRDQLAALSASAEALNSSLELGEVVSQAMAMLVRLTGAERGFLMLRDQESGEMRLEIAHNLDEDTVHRHASFAISRTIVDTVAREGRPILTTNAAADPRFADQESIAIHALRSIICAPLRTKDGVIGVVYADNRVKTAQFNEGDRDFVVAFANQVAGAIENARLFESVSIARNLMENVFESVTSGVITTDMDGIVTLFNAAAARILDLDPEQCVSLPHSLVLPVLGGIIPNLVDEVRRTGEAARVDDVEDEIEARGRVCVSVTAAPLTDAENLPQGVVIVLDDRTESMRHAQERAMVRRYLPAELVDFFADLGELELGGARKQVTVLFADVRGFTAFSERHDPGLVVEVINTYFGIAHDVIQANHGIVDKYMGDAVMAHFNSPLLPAEDHAWLAVKAAWTIKERLETLHAEIDPGKRLEFGIGINTGEALAGNVGARTRMEYTLMGDAVNVAKRLQEHARPGQILLGAQAYEQVKHRVIASPPGETRVKGRTETTRVYELIELLDPNRSRGQAWRVGL